MHTVVLVVGHILRRHVLNIPARQFGWIVAASTMNHMGPACDNGLYNCTKTRIWADEDDDDDDHDDAGAGGDAMV